MPLPLLPLVPDEPLMPPLEPLEPPLRVSLVPLPPVRLPCREVPLDSVRLSASPMPPPLESRPPLAALLPLPLVLLVLLVPPRPEDPVEPP